MREGWVPFPWKTVFHVVGLGGPQKIRENGILPKTFSFGSKGGEALSA